MTEVTKPDLTPMPIYRCSNRDCKAWVREELTAAPSPECPLCRSRMIRSIKHLPKLAKAKQPRSR